MIDTLQAGDYKVELEFTLVSNVPRYVLEEILLDAMLCNSADSVMRLSIGKFNKCN